MVRSVLIVAISLVSGPVMAQDRSPQGEAKWLIERLAGIKISADDPRLADAAAKIAAGDKVGAAQVATAMPSFLNVTVKQFGAQMSSRDETIREPLNDFSASIIGVTRDQRDARELLYGNFYYAATDATKLNGIKIASILVPDLLLSNNHYSALERANVDLGQVLVRTEGQMIAISGDASTPSPDPAGILTSRAWLSAHAVAGTNRRNVEFAFRQFMCVPITGWADTLASDVRIGRDVDRFPGGDNTKFLTTCKGCHTVMDGFRGAFSKWDYSTTVNGAIHVANGVTTGNFTPNIDTANRGVIFKMNRPDFVQFSGGYVLTDDSFVNNAIRGANATLFGWRGNAPDADGALSSRTTGVHAFGRLIANSQRFSQCMAKRVWASVCRTELSQAEMEMIFVSMGLDFETKGYNLKKLFETIAVHPKCRL